MKTAGLPSSWQLLSLGDMLHRSNQQVSPWKGDQYFDFIGLEDIESGTGDLVRSNKPPVPGNAIKSIKTRFSAGDILYGKLRPNLNKVYLARSEGICSTDIWVLRADERIVSEFAAYYLMSDLVCERASQLATGANLPRLTWESFANIPLPLPLIEEQERIIAILKKAGELRSMRKSASEKSREIASALFHEMFGDLSANSKGYKSLRFDQLGELERGVSKHRPRDAAFLFSGQYPFIQTGDVSNSGGWIRNYSQTYSDEGLKQSRLWPKGTLCITIAANIARTGILTFDACFPDSVVGFVPADGMTTEYAMFFLSSVQQRLEENAPQAAQKNINLKVLRDLLVPVAPRQDIALFSERVQKLRLHLGRLSANAIQIEDVLSELRLRAFQGELTRTWRLARGIEDENTNQTGRLSIKITGIAAEERPWESQTHRRWLKSQINEFQSSVRLALQEWKGTLVPTEDIENFVQSCSIENLAGHEDHIKRALNQLAGLGLIARLSIPNDSGDYVTAYRGLREDELSRVDDLDAIKRALEDD